ncbi:hypothetical protein E2C01_043702 [Portunus trituberculatus]|uniref:Uncharacterized protein n=1 Tax=Portunus trituberculatus TaxID=210409 RepID=A0A5B7FWT4_PORTR|nr:hypothetical protein [Portunus trituberculatus]
MFFFVSRVVAVSRPSAPLCPGQAVGEDREGASCREPDINLLLNNRVTQEHSPASPASSRPASPRPASPRLASPRLAPPHPVLAAPRRGQPKASRVTE